MHIELILKNKNGVCKNLHDLADILYAIDQKDFEVLVGTCNHDMFVEFYFYDSCMPQHEAMFKSVDILVEHKIINGRYKVTRKDLDSFVVEDLED